MLDEWTRGELMALIGLFFAGIAATAGVIVIKKTLPRIGLGFILIAVIVFAITLVLHRSKLTINVPEQIAHTDGVLTQPSVSPSPQDSPQLTQNNNRPEQNEVSKPHSNQNESVSSRGIPFNIPLAESVYCFKGDLGGEYHLSANSIDVNFSNADIKLCLQSSHPRRKLTSIRVGAIDRRDISVSRWDKMRWSQSFNINKVLTAGVDIFSLDSHHFSIQNKKTTEISKPTIFTELSFVNQDNGKALTVYAHN